MAAYALPGDAAILRAVPPGTLLPANSTLFRAVLGADIRRRMDEAELIEDATDREARLFALRAMLQLSQVIPTADKGGHVYGRDQRQGRFPGRGGYGAALATSLPQKPTQPPSHR